MTEQPQSTSQRSFVEYRFHVVFPAKGTKAETYASAESCKKFVESCNGIVGGTAPISQDLDKGKSVDSARYVAIVVDEATDGEELKREIERFSGFRFLPFCLLEPSQVWNLTADGKRRSEARKTLKEQSESERITRQNVGCLIAAVIGFLLFALMAWRANQTPSPLLDEVDPRGVYDLDFQDPNPP